MATETNSNPDNIIVFLDSIQRTIIATRIESSDSDTLVVTKPVILQVTPTPDKRLQVQLYPLFFREFATNRDEFPTWSYSKSTVVMTDVALEANLLAQYKQMFVVAPAAGAPVTDSNKVIKLFDDES